MADSRRSALLSGVFSTATSAAFFVSGVVGLPLPLYLPLSRRWIWGTAAPELSMDAVRSDGRRFCDPGRLGAASPGPSLDPNRSGAASRAGLRDHGAFALCVAVCLQAVRS